MAGKTLAKRLTGLWQRGQLKPARVRGWSAGMRKGPKFFRFIGNRGFVVGFGLKRLRDSFRFKKRPRLGRNL
jgi:hypothetical protein